MWGTGYVTWTLSMKVFHILEIMTFHDSVESIETSFDLSSFFDFACLVCRGRKNIKPLTISLTSFISTYWNEIIGHHCRRIWTLVKKKNWCSWTRSDLILTEITVRKGILLYNGRYSPTILNKYMYIQVAFNISSRVDLIKKKTRSMLIAIVSIQKLCYCKKKKKMTKKTLVPCSSFWSRGNILLASQWSWYELMVWRSHICRYKKI